MSAIKKANGAKNRISKRNKLIKEIASLPGQLKISNIFVKSIETVCRKKIEWFSVFYISVKIPTSYKISLNLSECVTLNKTKTKFKCFWKIVYFQVNFAPFSEKVALFPKKIAPFPKKNCAPRKVFPPR